MKKNFKSFIAITGIAMAMLLLNSCKKNDMNRFDSKDPAYMKNVREVVSRQIQKDGGIPQIIYINKRVPSTFVDMNGNPVTLNNNKKKNRLDLMSSCGGDLPDYADLKYYIRTFECNSNTTTSGFIIKYQYQFSWDNNIVLVNPYNSNNKTKGQITIKDASGVTQLNHTTYDVQIQDLGVDPGNSNNEIFAVNFTDDVLVPEAMLRSDSYGAPFTLRLGYTIVSDCSSLDRYAIAPEDPTGYGIGTGNADAPCDRNEKAYYLPPGTIASDEFGVSGWNIIGNSCGYQSPFIQPDLEEVQYKLDGSGVWQDLANTTAPPSWGIYNSRFIASGHIAESPTITTGTHTVQIRYRNIKYNSSSYQWQIPNAGNSCNTYDWTYETYTSQSFH